MITQVEKKFIENEKLLKEELDKVQGMKLKEVKPTSAGNKCVAEIVKKCKSRINILQILANKAWKLKEETINAVYFSLVRSIIDYNSIIYPLLSKSNQQKINAIQYKSLRISYRQPIKTTAITLQGLAKTTSIKERIDDLNERYLTNSI